MSSVQKSLRMPRATQLAIEEVASETGLDFSAATNALLEEALRARRCPGIVFTSGPSGRRATVAGTGIDVWEIAAVHRSVGQDFRRLCKAYHWLTEPQLRAALAYALSYPDEIEARIRRNESWTPSAVRQRAPALVRERPARPSPRR